MRYDEKEYREAEAAGRKALRHLEQALDSLKSARSWGIYDILGGGLISSVVKHSKMETASEHIEEAKDALRKFGRELQDVGYRIDLRTGDFWGFSDWFFDDMFSDLVMQERIADARKQVENAIRRVEFVLRELKHRNA